MSRPDEEARKGGNIVPEAAPDESGALERTLASSEPQGGAAAAGAGAETAGGEPGGLEPGRVIAGRFKVIELVGKGGMGVVYRVHQTSVDRQAALKVLHPHLANDPLLVRRFEVEARTASRILHPNGIIVYDYGREPDGLCFLAMEFVEGRSLRAVIKAEKRFTAVRAVRVLDQVLAYLEELHAAGIVHRDIKPDNVFLLGGKGERAKVIDFGLAKVADPQASDNLTQAGAIFGTPHYMSPEQGVGDPVDARTDLYACGVMLYELLAGKPPFTGGPATQIIARHVLAPVPHPHEAVPEADLPAGLWEVLQATLAKAPNDRPESAAALRARLQPFLQDGAATLAPGAVGVAPVAGGLVAATLPPIAAHLAVSPAVPLPTVPPASVPSRVVMSVPSVVLTAVPAVAPAAAPAVAPAAVPAAATEMLLRHPFEEDASLEPVGAPPDHIIGDDLVGVLNALFAALEGAVGPMADFVLRDALGAIGVSGEAPPDAMSRDDLRRLVDAAADSVPSSRRADFRARLHAALDDDDGDDLDEEDGDAGA